MSAPRPLAPFRPGRTVRNVARAVAATLLVALPAAAQAPRPDAAPAAHAQAQAQAQEGRPNIAGADTMLAHRASYRLSFDRARDNSNIAFAQGGMSFEVLDACDGWTTSQRLTLEISDRDGQRIETMSDYNTYESKDGRRLRFSMTQTSQGAVSSRIVGEATLEADGSGVVRYEQPTAREVRLPPGTLLPMMHTIRAIDAARNGQRLLVAPLMDGTNEEGAQDSTTLMLSWDGNGPAEPRFPTLANQSSARMRIAFFDRDQQSQSGGAAAPEYEVGLRYFANGVADDMKMEFGEFSLNGRMETLEALPGGC